MAKRATRSLAGQPLLDIASYARPGPARRDRLSRSEIEHIRLTVRRAPEVMVKVLTHGGTDLKSVQRHLAYIGRHGDVELETDDGEQVKGNGVEKSLLEDWDLDLDTYRRQLELTASTGRKPAKLVHKVLFSMPAGTPAKKVRAAVRHLARQEFGGKHRYVSALHTDEPHPHVHMVVKAFSEEGVRLNIRKETMRTWRQEFARHLRALGVAAHATERVVRGQSRASKRDGIFRAAQRGASTHLRSRAEIVARELSLGASAPEPGKDVLLATRRQVVDAWRDIEVRLQREGRRYLAEKVVRFIEKLPPPLTDKEWIAQSLRQHARQISQQAPSPTR